MANYVATDTDLAAIADAIRAKGGTSDPLTFPGGFEDAIADIQSGGGGQVYTGTIELQNEDVQNLIIPVDISSGSAVVVAYLDRTGTIVDGNVVYDDEPIMPASATNTNAMIWYAAAIKQCDNKNMKRDASNYTSIKRPQNMSYCQAYFGNNGSAIGLDVNIVSGTKISLPSQNARRHWCKSGYYARWVYTVVVA